MKKWRIGCLLLLMLSNQPVSAAPFTYITNGAAASVSIIDLASHSQIGSLSVGNLPSGIAISSTGDRLYVANSADNSLSICADT